MTSMTNSSFPQLQYLVIYFSYLCTIILNTDLGLFGHFLLPIQTVLFSYYTVSSEQIQEKCYGNGLGKKDKKSLGRFNVVIGTLSINNSSCILKKRLILFGYSSTLHHPVTTTIKFQFLRGQLLIISCILRVQYPCLRFIHLYCTPWPKQEIKPLSYTGGYLFLKCMW